MKKLFLLVAVLCMQSNVMELNAQTVKSTQKKKVTEKKEKAETQKMVPTVALNNQLDSIAYTIGMAQTQGLKDYLVGKLEMDTTFINDFVKGLNEGVKKSDKKEEAFFAGVQIGQQIKKQMISGLNKEIFGADSTKTISVDHFMAGFIAGTLGKDQKMTMEQAQEYARIKMETLKNKATEQTYGANKEAGAKFLAENKLKEGVVTTASGLQYKVITKGTGEIPTAESKVKVHYKGTMIDGTEFDSSYKRNEPATFEAGQVIKGWTEALTLMPVGSKWILYIPQELGYGSREAGPIKPFSTLIFEVELLSIEK